MINPAPRQSPSLQRSFSNRKRTCMTRFTDHGTITSPLRSPLIQKNLLLTQSSSLQGSFGDDLMMNKQRTLGKAR
ncbi:hypothetical protein CWO91_28120 [Bradyrhizobium genosp. SA-3]|nr:hypothetical protein CWO91_28120 [Bradyrhizobium genosp. SA-3]